jgi:hypothetical protein
MVQETGVDSKPANDSRLLLLRQPSFEVFLAAVLGSPVLFKQLNDCV